MDDESNPSCTPIPAPEPAAEPNLSKSDPALVKVDSSTRPAQARWEARLAATAPPSECPCMIVATRGGQLLEGDFGVGPVVRHIGAALIDKGVQPGGHSGPGGVLAQVFGILIQPGRSKGVQAVAAAQIKKGARGCSHILFNN